MVEEYKDEAVSAYRRDRGPGLRDAMQHAEDLAAQEDMAELWPQHSDRIARGHGAAARHTVEIALWALTNEVRVRHTAGHATTAVDAGERLEGEGALRVGALCARMRELRFH